MSKDPVCPTFYIRKSVTSAFVILTMEKNKALVLPNEISRTNIDQEFQVNQNLLSIRLENQLGERNISINNVFNKLLPKIRTVTNTNQKQFNRSAQVAFNDALRMPLLMAHCIGVMPWLGKTTTDGNNLRFTRRSWSYAYCVCSLVFQIIAVLLCGIRLFRNSVSLNSISYFFFYGGVCLTSFMILCIAKLWPALMKEVAKSEQLNPNCDRYLKLKCNTATIVILSLALLEHILSIISNLSTIMDCSPNETEIYKVYVRQSNTFLFDLVEIDSIVMSIFLQIFNLQATLNWNYSDLFIICISFYLTSRLEQLNLRLNAARGKYLLSSAWKKLREDYNAVTRLIRNFDEVISGVVFVSFASNLYFVCIQLFNIFSKGILFGNCNAPVNNGPFRGQEHTVYYVFSLLFLLARSLSVSLIAASVHSAWLKAAPALYDVPSPAYCTEVQRFLDQIHGDTVAMTGLKFFKVTRGLVLSVAGTIVTYELVLMQINRDNETIGPPGFNSSVEAA